MATKKAGAKKKVAKKASAPTKKKAAAPAKKKKAAAPAKKKKAAAKKKKAVAKKAVARKAVAKKAAPKRKTEKPKVEKPKTEKPKVEKPKTEKPKVEKPKVEKPKTEKPKVEKPKVEKPKVEKPKTEKPKTEKPKTEKPKVEKPAANEDLPRAPTAYRVDFRGQYAWPTVVVGEHAFAGEPGRPPLCEAGKPLFVAYERRAEDLHTRGAIASVALGYHVPGAEPRMQPMASSAARIDVPVNAEGELELWFKLTMTDGRVLWDSDFGRNHRVEIVPAGEIWALFEGERSA